MATVVRAARDAGATSIWANVLYLRPGTREHFLENLARDWPELLPRYEALYAGRAYLRDEVVKGVRRRVRDLARDHGVADRRERPARPGPAAVAEQLPLTAFLQAPTGEADGTGSRAVRPAIPCAAAFSSVVVGNIDLPRRTTFRRIHASGIGRNQ